MQRRHQLGLWALALAGLFTLFSTAQKLILGVSVTDPRSFLLPGVIGMLMGLLVGWLLSKNQDAKRALLEKNRFLANILDSIAAPFVVVDAEDYSIRMANKAANANMRPGVTRCHELSHHRSTPCQAPDHVCPLEEIKRTGKPVKVEHLHFDRTGIAQTVEVHAYPIFDEGGRISHMIEYALDITDRLRVEQALRENQARLNYLAHHDSLTGLPNRALFVDRLQQAIAHAHRKGYWVVLLFIDLDQIKAVNDTLGHPVGDLLLKTVAQRLTETMFEGDTVARLGGDEFTVIVEDIVSRDQASRVASRIAQKVLDALVPPLHVGDREIVKSGSIGISLYPQDGDNIDDLIKNADAAMYHAKSQGGNTYQFYSSEMNVAAMERLVMESALRKSVERGELLLYYQPQLDVSTGETVGVEALLRWQHSELGMVPPDRFIPVAEETGLIVPIGSWVLEQACAFNAVLLDAGLPPMRVSVNLSPRQLRQPNLVGEILSTIADAGLAPELLELEITENLMMQNPEEAISMMLALKDKGVRISCDDFGTGYSSLSYIRRLPLDALKIDRSFIRDITEDSEDATIVKTMIAMAQNMKLDVVAEGVETEEQAEFLRRQGCRLVQGFLYAKPLPATEVIEWMKSRADCSARPVGTQGDALPSR